MDEKHQDNTESKLTASDDKLHPLSSKDQGGPDHPQNNRMRAIIKRLGYFGYDKETYEYTPDGELAKKTKAYQPGKTFWDWMQLLIIPAALAALVFWFNLEQAHISEVNSAKQADISNANSAKQHIFDQQAALDQQRAAILQTYIDNIQDLLLNHNLLKSKPDDAVAILARARTLTALHGLDPERKGRLLIFLH